MNKFYRNSYKVLAGLVGFFMNIRPVNAVKEPDEGGFLVCSNHISATDPIKICYTLRKHQICYMAKKELFRIPLFSRFIRKLGAYPVDRSRSDVGAVRHTLNLLGNGECVGMFPQGTRRPQVDPRTTPVKPGAGMICVHTKSTVLPVFIATKDFRHRLFRRTYIVVGDPISFDEFGYEHDRPGEYARISGVIFDRICETGVRAGFLNEK